MVFPLRWFLSLFYRPSFVYHVENLFRPAHRVFNRHDGRWHSVAAFVLCELPRCENARGNQQNALAPLIHGEQCSIIRLLFASMTSST